MIDVEERFTRTLLTLRFKDNPKFVETYGFHGSQGLTMLKGQLLKRPDRPSRSLHLFMHPSTTMNLLPMPVALDMGAWVRRARERGGYERVILVGWSGGGALSLFYQAQAENPTITETPSSSRSRGRRIITWASPTSCASASRR